METIGKHKNTIKNGNLLFFLKNLYTNCTQIQVILSKVKIGLVCNNTDVKPDLQDKY